MCQKWKAEGLCCISEGLTPPRLCGATSFLLRWLPVFPARGMRGPEQRVAGVYQQDLGILCGPVRDVLSAR